MVHVSKAYRWIRKTNGVPEVLIKLVNYVLNILRMGEEDEENKNNNRYRRPKK